MLYGLLKTYTRFFVHLCYHSINVNKRHLLNATDAVLLAANHPNSFLDAIIIDILFDVPVTSLARGDAFKNKRAYKLLRALNMLPVYRSREGVQNLNSNYDTFEECVNIFRKQEAVLIFSEGLCVNEWHLRPLLKGTARLAFKAWHSDVPVKVLPVGINYSSFTKYGKRIEVLFGDHITSDAFDPGRSDGFNNTLFNQKLTAQLERLVYEIPPGDKQLLEEKFGKSPLFLKLILAPFALLGFLLHLPLYGLSRWVVGRFFSDSNHFDSVMFAVPLLFYPLYVLLLTSLTYIFSDTVYAFLMLLLLPVSAFCYSRSEVRKG